MFSDYSSATETTIIEETIIQETSSTESTTQESPSTPQPEQPQPTVSDEKLNVKVVQLADPKTGISWDGVSPITYTYPDGTTGTEPRDGARYEVAPGMYTTINLDWENSGPSDYDGTCPHCGKIGGDGTDGTCLHTLGEMVCPGCGKELPAEVCHTCGE